MMTGYLFRRTLQSLGTLLGVALLVFMLFHVVGGDPALQILGNHASPERIADLRRQLGFDRPLLLQFVDYLRQIVTFDFGNSYATHRPIRQMILEGVGPSLSLAVPAFILTTVTALSAALVSSAYRGRWIDRVITLASAAGMSIPVLALILGAQYFLAYRLGWFPISGYEGGVETLNSVALPVLIWVIAGTGQQTRFFRTAITEEARQDYVRVGRAKGLSEPRIYLKHILANCLLPILTNLVIQIPFLLLGSFLLESFFRIPGLGRMTIDAIQASDFPVIQAMTTLISVLFIVGNLLTDILCAWADPRVRLQ